MQEQGKAPGQIWERRELERKWLALYALTVALEVPAMLARYVAGLIVAGVLLRMTGNGASPVQWAKLAAVGPIVWSALALVNPRGGAWWWRQRLGGRAPSQREREAYEGAMSQLQARTNAPLPTPEHWFVRDDPRCEAAVYGNALMLTRGALELQGSHLPALLAHELGHLRGMDAKLTVAVSRLVLKPLKSTAHPSVDPRESANPHGSTGPHGPGDPRARQPRSPVRDLMLVDSRARSTLAAAGLTRWTLSKAMALLRGGLGLHLTAPTWAAVWRQQEYEADSWAAGIGWAAELAEFLQTHVLELDHPIPLVGLSSHTHPPTELRIDRLRQSARTQPPPTPPPDTGPVWIGEPA